MDVPSEPISETTAEMQALSAKYAQLLKESGFVPPGHFYSPVPSLAEIRQDAGRIFGPFKKEVPGVDLREKAQLSLLRKFIPYYKEQPFGDNPSENTRYHFFNPAYGHSDGLMLYCMLRYLRPKRLIEIGSGYSSCVTLDTDERFLGGKLDITFVEPYPELLLSLMREGDREKTKILGQRLQDVDPSIFDVLEANDILFIDSTHVSKIDSDVNHIFFNILPRLKPGVRVHLHDIFFPFEYPSDWVFEGRAWSEIYMLRAFLQFNSAFQVVLMNTFMEHYHEKFFQKNMPLCLKNPGGSIWLERV